MTSFRTMRWVAATAAVAGVVVWPVLAVAQGPSSGAGNSESSGGEMPSYANTVSLPQAPTSQNPFTSSVPEGKATAEAVQISFKDALDRALRNNLGLLLGADNMLAARGEKWKELSALLPNLSASATQSATQIDLAALGFRFNFPGVSRVVGPIGTFDARAYLKAPILNWELLQREQGASAGVAAAELNYKNARELVVLATGNEYLLTIASSARVDAAQAQVDTSQALYNKAHDQQTAGTIPAIDALRAQVELQTRQQQLIAARNGYAKQKLLLARTIGLPPEQEFDLTDKAPYAPLQPMSVEKALELAYAQRPDYLAAMRQVRSAQKFRHAATAEHLPNLSLDGNYGAAGVNVGESHGVFDVGATLTIPIFAGGKAKSDELQAEATLRQSQQQLDSLRAQIDYDVRSALLDLESAAEEVKVAQSALDLASQTLDQARDRFSAGVTDNLEVVQAQDAVAAANENYIAALYAHNVAKVSLARAIGYAEQGVRQYLESR